MISFLKIHYINVIQKDLVLTSNPSVYTEFVKPTELILFTRNVGTDDFSILSGVLALDIIGQQKPYLSRPIIPSYCRVNGCQVTLRRERLYNFLFNLNFRVLPRVRQFDGFGFSSKSNSFSFCLKNMLSFEELVPFAKFFDNLGYLHCRIHFCSKNNEDTLLFGRSVFLCIL